MNRFIIALPVVIMIMASCTQSKKGDLDDDGLTREEKKEVKSDDADFLRDAAEINHEGIYVSQLAATSATLQETKDMAKMVIADHKRSNEEVIALAVKMGISIPTYADNEAERKFEGLAKKEGADFDKEYADLMVKTHKDAIDRYQKAIDNCDDATVISFARSTLPKLQEHLTHAEHCQEMANAAK